MTRAQAARELLEGDRHAEGPTPARNSPSARADLERWWLRRMMDGRWRLHEKVTLFWHDHFPSAHDKTKDVRDLARQNRTLRAYGLGSFRDLLHQVTRDRAMLHYLDGRRSQVGAANENYARELMELFTLGVTDEDGAPNYTQDDVVALARALTGFYWDWFSSERTVRVRPGRFDSGYKVLFAGRPFEMRGNLGVEFPDGRPLPPERNVLNALLAHRDSRGRPTLARRLTRKLWTAFAAPDPSPRLVAELSRVLVENDYRIRPLLFAMLTHDAFYAAPARVSTAKTPVEFALQALAAFEGRTRLKRLPYALRAMGMELFNPPSVAGWKDGGAWLTTSRYLARVRWAQEFASGRSGKEETRIDPERLLRGRANLAEIVDDGLRRVGIEVSWSTRRKLIGYLASGSHLSRQDWREMKYRGFIVLLLSLPEFQVH
jgi:uncharacterized protein (DUF1800 family)